MFIPQEDLEINSFKSPRQYLLRPEGGATNKSSIKTTIIRWHQSNDLSEEIQKFINLKIVPVNHKIINRLLKSNKILSERSFIVRSVYSTWWRLSKLKKKMIAEDDLEYYKVANKHLILAGNFQKFCYVKDALHMMTRGDSFLDLLPTNVRDITTKELPTAIGIHMRFGDYLERQTRADLGELGIQYYMNALSIIDSKVGNQKSPIWVFTDEPERALAKLPQVDKSRLRFVDSFNLTAANELRLLSCLSYKILSNSTYSWWGGYFSKDSALCVAPDPLTLNKHNHPALSPKWKLTQADYLS